MINKHSSTFCAKKKIYERGKIFCRIKSKNVPNRDRRFQNGEENSFQESKPDTVIL